MKVPMSPERTIVRQYCTTSLSFGITESNGLIFTGTGRSRTAISNSAKPNAPTSAGTRLKPPARSRLPKLKVIKVFVKPPVGHQRLVRANLRHRAILEHHNAVGVAHGA